MTAKGTFTTDDLDDAGRLQPEKKEAKPNRSRKVRSTKPTRKK